MPAKTAFARDARLRMWIWPDPSGALATYVVAQRSVWAGIKIPFSPK
jgi:hypothetical protein